MKFLTLIFETADKFSHPVAYHQIWKIKKVKKSNFHVVKRQFGIELMCRGKVDYFSLQVLLFFFLTLQICFCFWSRSSFVGIFVYFD